MHFTPTAFPEVYIIDVDRHEDTRGFFARTYCEIEFGEHGISKKPVQSNISYNKARGTLRGMHYQRAPHSEAKLVRCTAGRIFDVIVDIRPDSATRFNWIGIELSSSSRRAVYIPKGYAHGFQTLDDETEVFYEMFDLFHPEYAEGLRWDDPALAITWPLDVSVISEKDSTYPLQEPKA